MEKDNILILEDGLKCELLNRVTLAGNNYFLAEQLNAADDVEKEEKAEVLLEVLKLLTKDFADNIDTLKVEDLI